MIIRIDQPAGKNWLIIAEGLRDPESWTRFVPCHLADSDRQLFEDALKQAGANGSGHRIGLRVCKDLIRRGVSVFEYDWDTSEDDVLAHAIEVALMLGTELALAPSDAA